MRNKIGSITAKIYALWVFLIVPLYFEDGYFNIIQAKAHVFLIGAICAVGVIAVFFLLTKGAWIKSFAGNASNRWIVILMICFGVSAGISVLFSENPAASFMGNEGWYIGGFVIISGVVISLFLVEYLECTNNFWLPVIAVNVLVFIMGIIQSAGIDIFRFHEFMVPDQVYKYISTIGNLNWFVGYLCLIVPIIFVLFINCDFGISFWINIIFITFAEMNMVLCGSDGLYLGVGFMAFGAIPYICQNRQRVNRTFLAVAIYGISLLIVGNMHCFEAKSNSIHGISEYFLEPFVAVLVLAIGVVGFVLSKVINNKAISSKYASMGCEVVLAAIAVRYLISSIVSFDEHWGTNRGKTWMYSLDLFRSFDLKEKLFGLGPEMLKDSYGELAMWFNRTILSAHSEPLQILLTMGIIGLAIWLAIVVLMTKRLARTILTQNEAAAFGLPLIAYFGQALVNGAQITNIGILIVVLALFIKKSEKQI